MTPREEKDMRQRLARTERLVSLLCERLGIPDQELLDMEKEEALDLLHQSGDRSALFAWLKKVNPNEKRRERRRGDAVTNAA